MKESTKWSLHLISGALIVVVLGIHFGVMHLDYLLYQLGISGSDPLAFESVASRSKMMFHVVVYLVLLAAALYHGFYGLRSLLFELPLGSGTEKIVSIAVTVFGVLLFIYGAHAIIIGYIS